MLCMPLGIASTIRNTEAGMQSMPYKTAWTAGPTKLGLTSDGVSPFQGFLIFCRHDNTQGYGGLRPGR
jgi:hypothetical protein